jgi:alpha-D-xyloside xylohydrolase
MQLEPDEQCETKSNNAHVPVPLVIGTHGWGMFVASTRLGAIDVARAKTRGAVEATFAIAPVGSDTTSAALRVDVFGADVPLDLYRNTTPPRGSFGHPPYGPWAHGSGARALR